MVLPTPSTCRFFSPHFQFEFLPFLPFVLENTTGHQENQGTKFKMVQIEIEFSKEEIEMAENHLKKCP